MGGGELAERRAAMGRVGEVVGPCSEKSGFYLKANGGL